jgi:hypothetical protein
MDPRLRRGRPADAGRVADLYLRARRAAAGIPPPAHDDDDVRRWIATRVMRETDVWLAVDDADEPVALLALDDTWLDQLYVAPELTGRGILAGLVPDRRGRRCGPALEPVDDGHDVLLQLAGTLERVENDLVVDSAVTDPPSPVAFDLTLDEPPEDLRHRPVAGGAPELRPDLVGDMNARHVITTRGPPSHGVFGRLLSRSSSHQET